MFSFTLSYATHSIILLVRRERIKEKEKEREEKKKRGKENMKILEGKIKARIIHNSYKIFHHLHPLKGGFLVRRSFGGKSMK